MKATLRIMIACAGTALLAACAAPRDHAGDPGDGADWPAFEPPSGVERIYRIDEQTSKLVARVDPVGPMAGLGHSHVVGGAVLSGRIVVGDSGARADVRVNAGAFEVDRPEWRRAHGLKPELDAAAIDGTRANLLGPDVLDAEAHPTIDIRSVAVAGPAWLPDVTLRIRWRDRVREFTLPVAIERDPGRLQLAGRLDIRHSDFGFEPFSAAGGALRVSDRIRVRFRIEALAERGDIAIIPGRSTHPGRNP
jgi:polyisoprenoid-binding protein YceI